MNAITLAASSVAYAGACGLIVSAVAVPAAGFALRRDSSLDAAGRHTVWLVVLITIASTAGAAFLACFLHPAQVSGAFMSARRLDIPPGIIGATQAAITVVAVCWSLVSLARLTALFRRVVRVRRLKREMSRLSYHKALPRGARLLASQLASPSAVGFVHPAILVPLESAQLLGEDDFRRIVTHESAHLRRADDVSALAFEIVAAFLGFSPFVGYVGAMLELEREVACDDVVVGNDDNPERYASLLLEMAEKMGEHDHRLAMSHLARRSGLVIRVQNILGGERPKRASLSAGALAGLITLGATVSGVAAFNAPALGGSDRALAPTAAEVRVRPYGACEHIRATALPAVCEDPHDASSSSVEVVAATLQMVSRAGVPTRGLLRIAAKGATP